MKVVPLEPVSWGMEKQHCSVEPDSLSTEAVGFFLQQGMVSIPAIASMPAIWQICSSWSRVVPAITLLPISSARIKDENRFSIAVNLNQDLPGQRLLLNYKSRAYWSRNIYEVWPGCMCPSTHRLAFRALVFCLSATLVPQGKALIVSRFVVHPVDSAASVCGYFRKRTEPARPVSDTPRTVQGLVGGTKLAV